MTDLDFKLSDFKYPDAGDNLEEAAIIYEGDTIVFQSRDVEVEERAAYFDVFDGISNPVICADLDKVANKLEGLEEYSAEAAVKHLIETYEERSFDKVDADEYGSDELRDLGGGASESPL